MPRLVPSRLAAACALALLLALSTAATAIAKGPLIDLRVVGAGNKTLAQTSLGASTTSIKTSPKATCLGRGTGGSGKSVQVKGPTALGVLSQASKSTAALRPLLVTDHFLDEFGLGLCTIGKSSATGKLSWYLKVNHKNPQLGGESVKLREGDEVLWALAGFPYPKELALVAPFSAHPGEPFQVTVFSYDDKGKRKPAAGATVTGASAPTDASGHTMVTLSDGALLTATRGNDIPSNGRSVAMCTPDGACPIP